jgi:hypothetical protein
VRIRLRVLTAPLLVGALTLPVIPAPAEDVLLPPDGRPHTACDFPSRSRCPRSANSICVPEEAREEPDNRKSVRTSRSFCLWRWVSS